MNELEGLARSQPLDRHGHRGLHASEMAYNPVRQPDLDAAQRLIAQCDAVQVVVMVRTWVTGVLSSEDARQICLTDLATYFQAEGPLDGITLDTRDNLGRTAKSGKAESGSKNARDLRTLRDLMAVGELDPGVKVFHARDEVVRQLWIPDIAGYVVARSIARHDPGYRRILADKVQIREVARSA